ncbi:MAG: HEAT repeat domain-containing protein [Chitinophagaceae bacterium]|nr:HEAT repeat domain-containing protein [Chitinophagaceae bacterium]
MDDMLEKLVLARQNKDASALERLLAFDNENMFSRSHTNILCQLFLEDWHENHEDILMTLGTLKDPASIQSIVQCMKSKLNYYTGNDIPRNAIWALRTINTTDSIKEIEFLTTSPDDFIREHALMNLSQSP